MADAAVYPKPTIAMVNGWCFGGAFTPLVSCDVAISWEQAEDHFYAKLDQSQFADREAGRAQGLAQFLDDKSFRPGLGNYARE